MIEREEDWNNMFKKYAEVSKKDESNITISEIDDPLRLSDSSSMIGLGDKPYR